MTTRTRMRTMMELTTSLTTYKDNDIDDRDNFDNVDDIDEIEYLVDNILCQ